MKKIKIGQIGIGHNHGEPKLLAVRKFPELFEVIGYAEENERWVEKRGEKKGYEGFAKYRHLTLKDNEGNVVIDFPILADAAADEYVNDINLRITRTKEKAAE